MNHLMKPDDQITSAPTPETDAHINKNAVWCAHAIVSNDFARKLERERDEALKHQELPFHTCAGKDCKNVYCQTRQERDEARQERDQLADALRGLIKLLDDGDLVRNTDGDDNAMVFMRQGVKITNAIRAANNLT